MTINQLIGMEGIEQTPEQKKAYKAIQDTIRAELGLANFHIKTELFPDGYLISGDHSMWHFELVECPGWLFGIWIDDGADIKDTPDDIWLVTVFAQHEDYIDKFKPSDTLLTKDCWFDKDTDSAVDWEFQRKDVLKIIQYVHDQPYLAWKRQVDWVDYNETYIDPETAKQEFVESQLALAKQKLEFEELAKAEREWMENKINEIGCKYKITFDENRYPEHMVYFEDPETEKSYVADWLEDEDWEEFLKISKSKETKHVKGSTFDRWACFKQKLED